MFVHPHLGKWLEKPTECKTLRHWYGLLVQKEVDGLILNCYNQEEILYKIPVRAPTTKHRMHFFFFNQSHLEETPHFLFAITPTCMDKNYLNSIVFNYKRQLWNPQFEFLELNAIFQPSFDFSVLTFVHIHSKWHCSHSFVSSHHYLLFSFGNLIQSFGFIVRKARKALQSNQITIVVVKRKWILI